MWKGAAEALKGKADKNHRETGDEQAVSARG